LSILGDNQAGIHASISVLALERCTAVDSLSYTHPDVTQFFHIIIALIRRIDSFLVPDFILFVCCSGIHSLLLLLLFCDGELVVVGICLLEVCIAPIFTYIYIYMVEVLQSRLHAVLLSWRHPKSNFFAVGPCEKEKKKRLLCGVWVSFVM